MRTRTWDDEAHAAQIVVAARARRSGRPRARRRMLPVRRLALRDAIDGLVRLSVAEEVSGSVRAWAVTARLAVDLAARGRLLPSIAADGPGMWVLGPLDAADVSRRAAELRLSRDARWYRFAKRSGRWEIVAPPADAPDELVHPPEG